MIDVILPSTMKKKPAIQPVILFDGVCNLCNSTVNFVIKRDRKNLLRFAALQSFAAGQLLGQYGLQEGEMKSFVLIENGKAYTQSTAALKVCRYMTWLWPFCYCLIIIPKFIRDGVYNRVAKNRYKWFGIKEQCMVPTAQVSAKFLL